MRKSYMLIVAGLILWRGAGEESSGAPDNPKELSQAGVIRSPANSPQASATQIPIVPESESLVVVVRYNPGQRPPLSITDIFRSATKPAPDLYAPAEGQPYSIAQILSKNREILSTHKFSIPTTIMGEYLQENGTMAIDYQSLSGGEADLLLPIKAGFRPSAVALVDQTGKEFTSLEFDFNELTVEDASPESSPTPSPLGTLWHWFIQEIMAQKATANLVLIPLKDTPSASVAAAFEQTENMVQTLPPWADFAEQIHVTVAPEAPNDLGCRIRNVGGRLLPQCPNAGRVLRYARQHAPEAELALVVTPAECYCGSVNPFGSRVVAIGAQPADIIIPHEFGHALGSLADEYVPPTGNGPSGRNCFDKISACETALKPFQSDPAAQCSPECNDLASFRPSDRIMRGNRSVYSYGPLETCLLQEALAELMGRAFTSKDCIKSTPRPSLTPTLSPTPTPDRGNYWGGGR